MLWALTEWAGPLSRAGTGEPVHAVAAGAPVQTGTAGTLVHVLLTVASLPARVADADVAGSPGGGLEERLVSDI